jgi:bacillithiol biosynthesis deacetylase BshB1
MNDKTNGIDLLVFSPHPDDAELGAGGLLARLKKEGMRTAIADLTRGELGTKGDAETRAAEAGAAARVLKLDQRVCLQLPDGHLADTSDQRREVISVLRSLKPRLVITTSGDDEHPDHRAAFSLVHSAFFLARLPKLETGEKFHAPETLWTYAIHHEDPSSHAVDVSDFFETKREAVKSYRSQFIDAKVPEGYRYGGVSDYLEQIELRGRQWGRRIGVDFAEAFSCVGTLQVYTPLREE